MKTAKEICEEIKVNKEKNRLRNLELIIKNVSQNNGVFSTKPYRYSRQIGLTRVEYFEFFTIMTINNSEVEELRKLGFKVEEKIENVVVDHNIVKKWFQPDEIQEVYKEIKYYNISACCGEENE